MCNPPPSCHEKRLLILLTSLFLGLGIFASQAAPLPFAAPVVVNTSDHADDLVIADFDGDGIADVAVLTVETGVVVRFGDGSGGYRAATASI